MSTSQLVFDLPHRTAQGRQDFFVAPSNQAAVEQIDNWQNWQPPVLLLLGAAGSGKTHLTKVWQAQTHAHSFYENKDAPFLFVDDIDKHVAEINEEALFEQLNLALHEGGRGLLLTAQTLEWWQAARLPDLRSRLSAVLVVEIQPPDEVLLGAVLVKLFADRQLQVSLSLIHWLLLRMERSFAAANEIVARLDKESARRNKPITITLARALLF